MSLVKVFNSQFLEFINDIQIVLPDDLNIKTAKYLIDKVFNLFERLKNTSKIQLSKI